MKLGKLPPLVATADLRIGSMLPPIEDERRLRGAAWMKIKQHIHVRDGFACQIEGCGRIDPSNEIDHIVPLCDGGTDHPSNLRTICRRHHREKSEREGGAGGARLRIGKAG